MRVPLTLLGGHCIDLATVLPDVLWLPAVDGNRVGVLTNEPLATRRWRGAGGPPVAHCRCHDVTRLNLHLRLLLLGPARWSIARVILAPDDLLCAAAAVLDDDVLAAQLRFAGIVTLLDPHRRPPGPVLPVDLEAHVAVADRIVVLRDADRPGRPVEKLEPSVLEGIGLYDPARDVFRLESWLPSTVAASSATHYCAVTMPLPDAALPARAVFDWLEFLQSELGRNCLRLKACVRVAGCRAPIVIHAIRGRLQPLVQASRPGSTPLRPRVHMVIPAHFDAAARASRGVLEMAAQGAAQPVKPPSTIRLAAVQ